MLLVPRYFIYKEYFKTTTIWYNSKLSYLPNKCSALIFSFKNKAARNILAAKKQTDFMSTPLICHTSFG